MSNHRKGRRGRSLGLALIVLPALAGANSRYEVVVEYDGPYFYVEHAPAVSQKVEDPPCTVFDAPRGIAAALKADGRLVNFVLDSGNKRILAFETNMDIARFGEDDATWQAGAAPTAAGEYTDDAMWLPEYDDPATKWVIPYSEMVRIEGETWSYVADLTGFTADDQVYTVDYADDPGPIFTFPTGSLENKAGGFLFELTYCISDYQGGGTPEFGIGEVDMGNRSAGVNPVDVEITEGDPPAGRTFDDLRAIFRLPVENSAADDELWLVNSTGATADQLLLVYQVTHAGATSYVEAYDDSLDTPWDVYVAAGPTAVAAAGDASGSAHATITGIADGNQVTGHTYSITQTVATTTITDLTTDRVLVDAGTTADFETGAGAFRLIPGLSITWDTGITNTSGTITTTRAIPQRYAFVCDRGNDRIKILAVPNINDTAYDDLPGDTHTCVEQPAGGTIGDGIDEDYWFSTPATVPEDWKTGCLTRPIAEGSITVTQDPGGAAVTWTQIEDIATAGPLDKVFELDWWEGSIVFGDGTHGALPPASTDFSVVYTTTPDALRYGTTGTGDGQFSSPCGVCGLWSSALGCFNVYVADTGNDRVQKFHFYPEDGDYNIPPRITFVCEWEQGSGATDLLSEPTDIDVQRTGAGAATYQYYVAVADRGNDRIVLYEDTAFNTPGATTAPTFETEIGGSGGGVGVFGNISGVDLIEDTATHELQIYVADDSSDVIAKFVQAPSPAIEIVVGTTLPASYPPTSNYDVVFTIDNAPDGAWVDFYHDTAAAFDEGTAQLCFTAGSIGVDDSIAVWNFADSPAGTPDDGDYYLYAILRDSGGNAIAGDQTTSSELLTIDSELVPTVQIRDARDGDATLLLAPGQEVVVQLELSYPDSVIGCAFVGTYPESLIEVTRITQGEGWAGTGYINHIFSASHDNNAGSYAVYSSVTGVPNGLTGTGSYVMARVRLRALEVLSNSVRVETGTFAIDTSNSGVTDKDGNKISGSGASGLAIKLAYVGDIAHRTTGTGGQVPSQQPEPDGYMEFADVAAFTLGWNGGSGFVQDPISDLGPTLGESPGLISTPDKKWDVYDLLAFTGNWSWFSANGYTIPQVAEAAPGASFSPLGEPVPSATRMSFEIDTIDPLPGDLVSIDAQVQGAIRLSAAMVRLTYDPAELELVGVEKGEFLARDDGNVLLTTVRQEGTCEMCLGRLQPKIPGISGSGRLGRMTFRVLAPLTRPITCGYDLRDWRNHVAARGYRHQSLVGGEGPAQVHLHPSFPNPAGPAANIVFTLPDRRDVQLAIFDITGRRLRTLVEGLHDAGMHTVRWNGQDQLGRPVGSGVYFYQLRAGGVTQSRKLLLAR